MNHRSLDLFAVIAFTLVAVVLVLLVPSDNVVGRIWTLPLVLLLPGYALTSTLFIEQTPGVVERIIFSLGLSLVIVVLGGLVLNWTPAGLRTGSWVGFLSIITIGASLAALMRRRGQSRSTARWSGIGEFGFTFRQGLLLGLAALVVCTAVAVSIRGAQQQPRPGFTQLWILPVSGANAKNTIHLGVKSMESTAMDYRLDVNIDGKVVKEWPSIALNPNEKWEVTFVLPTTSSTGIKKVEADLYRLDTTRTIYRHVVLWFGS